MPRNLATALCATVALLTAGAAATPAFADALPSEAAVSRVITVPRDKSLSFRLEQPATKIVVAQPDIAEVVATTDRSFYVRGLELGSTNLLVYGPGGRLMEVIDVRVGVDAQTLQRDLSQALPNEHIHVESLGEGVLLTGNVSNPALALRAKAIADSFAPDGVTSMLKVNGAQVVLEVRILEANRSAEHDFGVAATISNGSFNFAFGNGLIGNATPTGVLNLSGGAGHTSIDVQLAALEQKGTIHTLARPNLVAMSGEKASFLAGGEFPFPVPAGQNLITVEFRPYGVKLNFTPTVQDDGEIRLLVEPEVSQLDNTNTLRISGVTIPALTVRRTSTTVQLKSGASLAIGGLFQHGYTNSVKQVPGLGDIPILGALFRSTQWQRNETELLIIVTPRIVNQSDFDSAKTRTIAGAEPSTPDLLIYGKALDKPLLRDVTGRIDPAGDPAPPTPQLRGEITPAVPASGK
ncbi:type II and III secretion system protein family protein [Phenylobacterium sp.]|uniref:type II and III secretion system protein family protein n=1 Tax=Phenylobacterium sp. TaxID=1871053 RepID=UPI0035615311